MGRRYFVIKNKDVLSISDFAQIARTSTKALRFYDRAGILSPVVRGENKYRYYSLNQLAMCNAIRILRSMNITIAEIRSLIDRRSPELACEILERTIRDFQNEQYNISRGMDFMTTMLKSIKSSLDADVETVTVKHLQAEQIMLGDLNDYSGGRTDYDALTDFYDKMSRRCVDSDYELLYPVWGVFSEERIRRGDFVYPDRYYFYNPRGPDQRPAGLYAIGYTRAGYGNSEELYDRVLRYICENGFEICGDAYEEYPQNELCINNDMDYVMRVMIAIRERRSGLR